MTKRERERDKSKWNSFQEGPQVHAWHEHDLFSSTNRQVFGIGWRYQKGEMCIKICSHINILLCMRRNTLPIFGSTNWISPSLQTETWAYFFYTKKRKKKPQLNVGFGTVHTSNGGFALLPCVCHGEAPLLVDVVVEQHASQQTRRVAGWQTGWNGCGWAPVPARALLLQKVLPQDLHQILV